MSVQTELNSERGAAAVSAPRSAIRSAKSAWSVYAAGVALLALLLGLVRGDDYWLNIVTLSFVFAAAAAAWNIIGGYGGQLSFGHGVYFAIGAYTEGILYGKHHVSPWLCILIAIPAAVVVAAVTNWPIFRLRGPFFSMATLALNQVVLVLATFFSSFTGGSHGLSLPYQPSFANLTFTDRWIYGAVILVFLAMTIAVVLTVSRSRLGYALRAVREDDESAAAVGFSVFRVKMTGMLLSAGLTAVAGSLFAVYVSYIDPESVLNLGDISVRFVLIALLGGMGTVSGPVIGALVLVPAIIQLQGSLAGSRPGISLAAVGLLLVFIPLLFRRGIVGTATQLRRAVEKRRNR